MFKKISLVTVVLAGVLLTGCSQQSAPSTDSSTKTEKTQKSTKSAATPKKSTNSVTTSDTNKASTNANTDSDSQKSATTATNSSDANSQATTDKSSDATTDTNTNSQQSQTSDTSTVNLATSTQAVDYLATQLSNTYDKTTTQYVANGKVTWNNVEGYQVNIYSKNSDSPVGSYLVPADGQYFQIW